MTDKPLVATRENPVSNIAQDANNDLRATAGGEAYQWFYLGDPITDATDSVHIPRLLGLYSVEITSNGCTTLSDDFSVIVVGFDDSRLSKELKIYPNPVTSILSLELSDPVIGVGKVIIYDQRGSKVYESSYLKTTNIFKRKIDISELKPGFYIVKVSVNDKEFLNRIIKSN